MTEPARWPYTAKPTGPPRKWQARIVATDEALADSAHDMLFQADFTFHAPDQEAAWETVQWTMRILRVSEAMRIEYVRPWEGDRGTPRREQPGEETITIQNDAGRFEFVTGREYQIQTMIPGLERRPRYSRMGFLGHERGTTGALQFSARGPDRTHDHPYGGTQTVSPASILASREVETDHAKRYCALTKQQFIKVRDAR